ncbi:ABC transporter, ATP-binding protein [Leucobacter sp. 7(1)]|uniref:ATP-binding cassette domain-containing protein n=1 Tax=Leucobacter sp. 7(1) TaxID=1255613 RepID=UPI00097F5149|nr:ATP-binding cassette domain-containing protein [Leucobacter sp. 7(1)]SJN08759.1 ABC transporter, ATP-binding protein [Leucobacter sp. 7(1)]
MNHPVSVTGLTKTFGSVRAVSDVTFTAAPGRVTGFLGPNGSGKTTTLAMILGLVRPDSGTATIGGVPYAELERPALTVGASLSADFHPAHTGRAHLDIARRAIGVPEERCAEVLELVGLSDAADRKTGGYSLGMRQRLALGAALLGDPDVILLDEPINGLDPEGIRWIRVLLRHLASTGKTVLLSSHLLSEVQQSVDDVVVIRRGELAFAGTLEQLQRGAGEETVLVSAGDQAGLGRALEAAGAQVRGTRGDTMRVTGLDPATVGRVAFDAAIPLSHLSIEAGQLEQSFLDLIDGSANGATTGSPPEPPSARTPHEGAHA